MDFKKIEIDEDTYRYWDKDNFELHIRACDNRGFTLAVTDEVLSCDKIYIVYL